MAGPRVVLADGDLLVRDVLRAACAQRGVDIVGEADDAVGLRRCVMRRAPDVVILGDHVDGTAVDDALRELLEYGAKVVVVSGDPSPHQVTRLVGMGARGYLMHDASPDEVASAVLAVGRGAAVLNPTATLTILSQWRRLREKPPDGRRRGVQGLTPRESEVLTAMAEGLSTKAIATRLTMAPKTVENHKIRIFDKLGVRTQAQAVTVAIGYGLAEPATDGAARPDTDADPGA